MRSIFLPRWAWLAIFAALFVLVFVLIFRLGSQASAGVTLNDPVVWVEDGARGRVLLVNGVTEEVTASIDVGDPGDALRVLPRGRDAVFLNGTSQELGVIGAVSLSIDSVERLSEEGEEQDLELHADFDVSRSGFVVSPERILVVEPGAGAPVEIATPEPLGDRVVDAEGELVALTSDQSRVGVTNGFTGFFGLADLPEPLEGAESDLGLARSGLGTFVVDAGRRAVNEILDDGSLGVTTCISGSLSDVRIGGNVASDSTGPRMVLVHDPAAGVLSVSLPDTNDCLQIPIDSQGEAEDWGDPVATDGVAYLPNYADGQIIVVDLEERVVLEEIRFGVAGRPFELEVFDGTVWANEPLGSLAAVLRGDEISVISKISTVRVGGAEQGDGEGVDAAAGDAVTDEIIFGRDGEFGFGDTGIAVGDGGDGAPGGDGQAAGDGLDADDAEQVFDGELSSAPVILEAEAQVVDEPTVEELLANFSFSSDTINAGEIVQLSDSSTGGPTSWNWDFGDGTGASGPVVEKAWEQEGVFTVTLFVSNDAGEEASQSFDFTVVAPDLLRVPTADFSFASSTVEVGETLQFFDQSTGDPDSLLWSFGDGTTASGSAPTHSFSEPGQFRVALTANNEAGSDTAIALITVVSGVSPPVAIIGPFPGIVEVGQTITLVSQSTNSPTATSWDFGDGDAALGTTVRHAWTQPGTFRIRLAVSNSAGEDDVFRDITVEPAVQPPVARFSESSLEVVVGEELRFNDLSLNNPTSLAWEFGDNTTGQGANVAKVWDEAGTFTVTLTARNQAGSDSTAKTVTVVPLPPDPPLASFTVPTGVIPVNQPLRFTDTSTGDPTEWLWNFGDGGPSSTAPNPVRPFAVPGTYTVTLTATNAGGSSTTTQVVTVVNPPVASFTSAANELVVSFTDSSTNAPTEWEWDFGDGTASVAQDPTKTYALPGTYTVSLIATNEGGTSTEFIRMITVNRAPTAAFAVSTGALTAQFTNTSTDLPIAGSTVLWDFGDGTTSPVRSPNHLYAAPGTYTVMLTVTNGAGTDTVTRNVTVANAPPTAAFVCSQNVGQDTVFCDAAGSTGASTFAWSAPAATNPTPPPGQFATFAFTQSGVFPIELTVTAADGQIDTFTRDVPVTVTPPAPTITVAASANGFVISANASVTANGPVNSYVFTLSGPESGTMPSTNGSASFTVTTPGAYTVTAIGTGNGQQSNPASDSVTVTAPPPPPPPPQAPTVTITSATTGAPAADGSVVISASAMADEPIANWSWNISAGTGGGTSENASFTVPGPGSYDITVTATDVNDNLTGSATVTVIVP